MHKLRYKSMFLFTCYINKDRDTATAETKTIGYVQTKAPHRTPFFLPMELPAATVALSSMELPATTVALAS
jgi:hypothetical protein